MATPPVRALENVKAIKACSAGERVSFRARVLRSWEIGGARMCLAGDESALTRIEMGDAIVEPGRSYEFQNALVRQYPGGWHSASLVAGSEAEPLADDVPVSQDEAYIERTYRILAGVQRKKARGEGREPPWRHPADRVDDAGAR
jgi:hypothetical protein